MKILDGKKVADDILKIVKDDMALVNNAGGRIKLAVIQVGDDSASNVYIRNKSRVCDSVGIKHETYKLGKDVSESEVVALIEKLNDDKTITGILLQLPLPHHLQENYLVNLIKPEKDVDGFCYVNQGMLMSKSSYMLREGITPCTPLGILNILAYYDIDIAGKDCVVVGRSNIVGIPIALMLSHNNGTVTLCHSHTKNLKDICHNADILICAIGKPKFFTKDYIKDGAVVIDVGINRDENGKLCGDVDFDGVSDMDISITPVPGGCGPLTVASLMSNCISAYEMQTYNCVDSMRKIDVV